MTLSRFRFLSPRAQLLCTLLDGTYLTQRRQAGHTVLRYHLCEEGQDFLAEVGLDEAQEQFVVLRSFSSTEPLAV